ncbi:hypothetical protein KVT40_002051 [Elsinoe batatas]|uniref:Serine aminopeptidase S33 domain-containing protein n=1 Tax=Elsinoe batatas TaxID=2601811 RepID=A0A8K0L7M5_9PEZI|nr:hypothetical protein KVT40_002051 [Elsinoe batatas]
MPIIQTGFKRTYYKEWKPDSGNAKGTVLLAHGLGGTNNFYTPLIPHLTAAGYRCIAYDLHGMGLSPYSGLEQSVATLAQDVIDLMDALDIKTATFVGHSMSGMTGPCVAATYPERITALALCAPVYPTEAAAAVFDDRIGKIEATRSMEALADLIPWAAPGSKATGLQRAFIRDLILRNDPAAYVSLCRVISSAWEDVPKYEDVECPVLIVAGEEDKNPSVKMCETILERLGSARKNIKVLNGVGHWTVIESPDETGLAIRDFLGEIQKDVPRI